MSEKQGRGYQISPQPIVLGGGWKVTLLENGQEAKSGVFPIPEEPLEVIMNWWNSLSHQERTKWIAMVDSSNVAQVRYAYLMGQVHSKALQEATDWLKGAPRSAPGSV